MDWIVMGPTSLVWGYMRSLTSAFVTSNSLRRGWEHGGFKFGTVCRYRKVRKYFANLN